MIRYQPKPKHWKSKRYLQWIARKESCLTGSSPCIPHHHRHGSDGGTGIKPSDVWAIPVTHEQHNLIHVGKIKLDNDWVRALCMAYLTEYLAENNVK